MTDELQQMQETEKSSTLIFDGRVIKLHLDEVTLPDGNTATREYCRHPGGVCVLPLDERENVTVVRQYRYPHAKILTELPAGKRNGKAEDLREAALRELSEETGYTCQTLTYLGEFYPSPAILDEVIYLFLAEGLTQGELHLDDDEFLAPRKMPISELVEEILAGKIEDGKTQAATLRVWELLRRRKQEQSK